MCTVVHGYLPRGGGGGGGEQNSHACGITQRLICISSNMKGTLPLAMLTLGESTVTEEKPLTFQ